MTEIYIALSSDNSNFFALATTLVSALENKHAESFYNIHVFCAGDVSQENKNKVATLETRYEGCSITFVDMSGRFENIKQTHAYVTAPSAYKMCFASHFAHLDKLLYLDTDVLVRDDLAALYAFDIKDNYLGGVPVFVNYFGHFYKIEKLLELPSLDFYINAGVMLMNLTLIREHHIEQQWQNLLGSFQGSVDQHILNKVCYPKIAQIPCRYNLDTTSLPFYRNLDNGRIAVFYGLNEARKAYENPGIFHYTGKIKPWQCRDVFLANEWLRYFMRSPFADMQLTRPWYVDLINKPKGLFSKIYYKKRSYDGSRTIFLFGQPVYSYTPK